MVAFILGDEIGFTIDGCSRKLLFEGECLFITSFLE